MSMSEAEAKQLKKGDVVSIDGVHEANGERSLWRIVNVNHSQPGTFASMQSDTHGSALLTNALLPRVKFYMASAEVAAVERAQELISEAKQAEPPAEPDAEPAEPDAETPTVPQGDGSAESDAEQAPAAPKRKRSKRASE